MSTATATAGSVVGLALAEVCVLLAGMTSRTRLPTGMPLRLSNTVGLVPPIGNAAGAPVVQVESTAAPAHDTTTYCTTIVPVVTALPVPLATSVAAALVGSAAPVGILIVGAPVRAPVICGPA